MIKLIKFVIIIFLITSSAKVYAGCTYSATADVENNTLVNKKEKYVCEEDKNFLVTFFTTDEWSRTATWTILFIMENL
tara:strand:- start:4 stop:237 length:234 start_codon:yes stop_codon:yes gene_type:complete